MITENAETGINRRERKLKYWTPRCAQELRKEGRTRAGYLSKFPLITFVRELELIVVGIECERSGRKSVSS